MRLICVGGRPQKFGGLFPFTCLRFTLAAGWESYHTIFLPIFWHRESVPLLSDRDIPELLGYYLPARNRDQARVHSNAMPRANETLIEDRTSLSEPRPILIGFSRTRSHPSRPCPGKDRDATCRKQPIS